MKKNASSDPAELAQAILSSKKYRNLNLPPETVVALIQHGLENGLKPSRAMENAREKLHNIIAPYLGDPDYSQASEELRRIQAISDSANSLLTEPVAAVPAEAAIKTFCLQMLESHASTRERVPVMDDFYRQVFEITGIPHSILDLASALHPFSHPWMNLQKDTQYYAYDLHQPRVDLINQFFLTANINGQAIYGDILINPPTRKADVAFFFKEAHRFDQRLKGCNREFWKALNVNWLVVSLPATNLTGKFNLADRQRKLVIETLAGLAWPVTERLVGNELLFFIQKYVVKA